MKTRNYLAVIFPFAFSLTGCQKDGVSPPSSPQPGEANLQISVGDNHTLLLKMDKTAWFGGSCSKDSSDLPAPQDTNILLSAVYANGKLSAQFQYDADGNPVRFDYTYLNGPPPQGIICPDYEEYTYNGQGQLVKRDAKKSDGTLLTRTNLTYFADGNLKQEISWKPAGPLLWKSAETTYSVPDKETLNGLEAFRTLLEYDFTATFFSELITFYTYGESSEKNRHEVTSASGRVYASDGTLERQTQLRKSILPEQEDVESIFSYEYIKQ